jgi:acetyl-CoA acetyltransferase
MSTGICIAGVGMTPFSKPSAGAVYESLAPEAASKALKDAGISYDAVDLVFASYVMGDTCSGQRGLYGLGLSGVPIINVNNACASGSTAIYLARQAVLAGQAECVLVVGFEQMPAKMMLGFSDRASPFDSWDDAVKAWGGPDQDTSTTGWFAAAAKEYQGKFGVDDLVFARIAAKARKHGSQNPCAVFRDELTPEEVMQSRMICSPLTMFECSAPTSGAAAAVVCSRDYAERSGMGRVVEIVAQSLVTDRNNTFSGSMMDLVGGQMSREAAASVYEAGSTGPEDIDVIELHDCFASNELMSYEALQLAAEGEGERLVHDGDNSYGGRWVVNPSGGLLSKGHPVGATGVAQCVELVTQLRGEAGVRQVKNARTALQHNLGIGGACVVSLYRSS